MMVVGASSSAAQLSVNSSITTNGKGEGVVFFFIMRVCLSCCTTNMAGCCVETLKRISVGPPYPFKFSSSLKFIMIYLFIYKVIATQVFLSAFNRCFIYLFIQSL
ncbi:hypothetical protein V8G54_006383 [Vigna mungo]|uniref:Uncharacterized protein n=1 Tax=Vigna mungo TaxID=3915 RepID=A0AAQ3NYX0_VIGMU